MQTRRHLLAATSVLLAFGSWPAAPRAQARDLTSGARKLDKFYNGLDVENRWIAGQHIDWESGDPDGRPETLPGHHTHCSAFVAAAAERLGIYILRPPEHGQVLLANAQNEWLADRGQEEGWRPVVDALAAQQAANAGLFVVASYHNRRDDKPGHIAIVRPSKKPTDAVTEEGPDVIQAGSQNSKLISLRDGFAGHPHAWADNLIDYYAHEVPRDRLGEF